MIKLYLESEKERLNNVDECYILFSQYVLCWNHNVNGYKNV